MGVGRTSEAPSSLSCRARTCWSWWPEVRVGTGISPSAVPSLLPSQGLEDRQDGYVGPGPPWRGQPRALRGALAVVGCSGSAVCVI